MSMPRDAFWGQIAQLRDRAAHSVALLVPREFRDSDPAAPLATDIVAEFGPLNASPYFAIHSRWEPEHLWTHALPFRSSELEQFAPLMYESPIPELSSYRMQADVLLAEVEHLARPESESRGEEAAVARSWLASTGALLGDFCSALHPDARLAYDAYLDCRFGDSTADAERCAKVYLSFLDQLPANPWVDIERSYVLNFSPQGDGTGAHPAAIEALRSAVDHESCPTWLLAQTLVPVRAEDDSAAVTSDPISIQAALSKPEAITTALLLAWILRREPVTLLEEAGLDEVIDTIEDIDLGQRNLVSELWSMALYPADDDEDVEADDEQEDEGHEGEESEAHTDAELQEMSKHDLIALVMELEGAADNDDEAKPLEAVGDPDLPSSGSGIALSPNDAAGESLLQALGQPTTPRRRRSLTAFWPGPIRSSSSPELVRFRDQIAEQAGVLAVRQMGLRETAPARLALYAFALRLAIRAALPTQLLEVIGALSATIAEVVGALERGSEFYGYSVLREEYLDENIFAPIEDRFELDGIFDLALEEQTLGMVLTSDSRGMESMQFRLLSAACALLSTPPDHLLDSPSVPPSLKEALRILPPDAWIGLGRSSEGDRLRALEDSQKQLLESIGQVLSRQQRRPLWEVGADMLRSKLGEPADHLLGEFSQLAESFGDFDSTMESGSEREWNHELRKACQFRISEVESVLKRVLGGRDAFVEEDDRGNRRDIAVARFGRTLADGTWSNSLPPRLVRRVELVFPERTVRTRLGGLVLKFADARQLPTHEARVSPSTLAFFVPEASSAPSLGGDVFDLLALLADGVRRTGTTTSS